MKTLVNTDITKDCLNSLKFSSNWTGSKMLWMAVPWYMEDNKLTAYKDLYPRLSPYFDHCSADAAGQDIRYAIARAFEQGSREAWEKIFPGITKAPSNMVFIATVAEYLQKGTA